ncbi:MqnA/MqnD/SBP family protein [Ferroplasma sp.]|uniref:MqnA/MqnD/SBP family protein n=1 Tax=Ferroplasma sp. TaxID=2591003 RepID=UPI00307DAE39
MINIINLSHSDPLAMTFSAEEITRKSAKENYFDVINGKTEIGMVSLVTYLKNKDKLKLIKSMNIHTKANSISTILVSKYKYLKDNIKINVTSLTKTTEFYMELVLQKMGINYEIKESEYTDSENLLKDSDYALVIGDDAIKAYSGTANIILDIGLEFSKLYEMEPVYAVSASLNEIDEDKIKGLDQHIKDSKKYIHEAVERNYLKFNVKKELMEEYYRVMDYSFNDSVLKTIEFADKLNE